MKSINVLSLFDGMSCGRIALERAGISVDKYYSAEVDKYAIKVADANWPQDAQHRLGDAAKWQDWNIDWASINLLIGGSPCQGFSFAGKQLAFDDPRSKLFFVYVDILNHIRKFNPNVKFLLENVKMKKEYIDVISSLLGVEPVFIDSELVSACQRPRFYWSNKDISIPKDKNVTFGDVIDYRRTDNEMSKAWSEWWHKNKEFQIKKSYSKLVMPNDKGICMTTRQYASWNGNFIYTPNGTIRKPTKNELSSLIGAPFNYLDCVSQRQAEVLTGNGWTVDVISHIFRGMIK